MIMSVAVAEATRERRDSSYFYEPAFAEETFEELMEQLTVARRATEPRRQRVPGGGQNANESELQLLTPTEEHACFRQLNYLKYILVCSADPEQRLLRDLPPVEDLDRLQRLLDETRERIITGNLRLVFALARRFVPSEHSDFEELVSLGNEALMRACEKFDYRIGYRFSSYAYQAIKCAMFGWLRTERKKRERLPMMGMEFGELADDAEASQFAEVDSHDDAKQIARLLGQLDERDREIVKARFGLDCPGAEPVPFRAISKSMGLSTTRVVQRYQRAMAKLRLATAVA